MLELPSLWSHFWFVIEPRIEVIPRNGDSGEPRLCGSSKKHLQLQKEVSMGAQTFLYKVLQNPPPPPYLLSDFLWDLTLTLLGLAYLSTSKDLGNYFLRNDLLSNDLPYSKGFMKFGCPEPSKKCLTFETFVRQRGV